jgi:hypothetical protein
MRIRKKFLQLTKKTYPHGTEHTLERQLPKDYHKETHGNYFVTVGENYSTMFTCHLDTASKKEVNIRHTFNGNMIKSDGTTILGADDKAGMIVLLYMIEKMVPGLYYFFVGEEVGCIGSKKLSKNFNLTNINKVVSFDRRGTHSIITKQLYGRCCSNEFAETLCKNFSQIDRGLKLKPDDTGIMTDSAQFISLIPECTNISVGYYKEHTVDECQDIEYLRRLCLACVKIDWESLPIVRKVDDNDIKKDELNLDDLNLDFDLNLDDLDLDLGLTPKMKELKIKEIELESKIIFEFLKTQEFSPLSISWDGMECYCEDSDGTSIYIGNREELSYFIDAL